MSATTESKFVAITYTEEKLTTKETSARERLETTIQQAMQQFHSESMGLLVEIEVYPCPEDCEHCRHDAEENAA